MRRSDLVLNALYTVMVPDFGYSTLSDKHFIAEVNGLPCRPCGIHGGKVCPEKHFKCMNDQNTDLMFTELLKLLELSK
jgi:heptosyltransferase-2